MRNPLLTILLPIFVLIGCGEHDPGIIDEDPPPHPPITFGEEEFIPGPYYIVDGVQVLLLQSNRVISVQFDSAAPNSVLEQVAERFGLVLYPELKHPTQVDWETEKRRTSLWVIPEGSDPFPYYSPFPRTEHDHLLFGMHPVVSKSFPSYVDLELQFRYFTDDRFYVHTLAEVSRRDVEDFNSFYNVDIIDEISEGDAVIYQKRITAESRFNTIDMANEYHRHLLFVHAYPDFIITERDP